MPERECCPELNQPRIMGILNVTPDSFSDGGRFTQIDAALHQAEQMIADGADILDIGGESTRPGAQAVSAEQELERVVPIIQAITARLGACISIDTSKAVVMREAVAAGAAVINDVNALRAEGALQAAAELSVPVCLMHMQGEPRTMQAAPQYADVVADVKTFLLERTAVCAAAGIARENLWLDPGFGFGKTLDHNLALLAGLDELVATGMPVLVGISRKSMIGAVTGKDVDQRLSGSLAAAQIGLDKGAKILRVHDVAETSDMLKVWKAVRSV